jgi:putative salt-induced outer membrane protein YdiY
MKYEDNKDRWNYLMFYLLSEKDNETSENRFTANLIRDWLIPDSKWFYFSKLGYDWDEFKDWDYRIRSAGGIGYELVKNEKLTVRSRCGPAMFHTEGGENDTTVIEMLFGLEMMWKIRDKHTLDFTNSLFPSISNKGEYRNVTILDWKVDLNYYRDLGVIFGLFNEYDSSEEESYDLRYNISLVLGL